MEGDELIDILDEAGFKPGKDQNEIFDYLEDFGIDLTDAELFEVNITDVRPDGTFDLEFSTCINTNLTDKVLNDQKASKDLLGVQMERNGETTALDYKVEQVDCTKITVQIEFPDPSDVNTDD